MTVSKKNQRIKESKDQLTNLTDYTAHPGLDQSVLTRGPAVVDPLPIIPRHVANIHRRRKRSYSDIPYDWHFYRSTGKPLEQYHILELAQHRNRKAVIQHVRRKNSRLTQDYTIKKANLRRQGKLTTYKRSKKLSQTINPMRIFHHIFDSYTKPVVRYLKTLAPNGITYAMAWLTFYLNEYVYLALSLRFPIFDWLVLNNLFAWSFQFQFYFSRLIICVYLPIFFIFLYFQRRPKKSHLDSFLGFVIFTFITGSLFLYHRTGVAPFVYTAAFFFLFFFFFMFYYYVPKVLTEQNLAYQCSFCLPAPKRPPSIFFLPKYSYKFSFLPVVLRKRKVVRNFTEFPFVTAGLNHLATEKRLIRHILLFASTPRLKRYIPIRTREPLFGGRFESYHGHNPYDILENAWRGDPPVGEITHPIAVTRDIDEEPLHRLLEVIDNPISASNTLFFCSNYRRAALSLYKRHFTSEYDTFDLHLAPRMPLWQSKLLQDPYFSLYIWLKHVSPPRRKPRSIYFNIYSRQRRQYTKFPYPIFHWLLVLTYRQIEGFFDIVTLYYFYKLPALKRLGDFYNELFIFGTRETSLIFSQRRTRKKICWFFITFADRLYSDYTFIEELQNSATLRYELIHYVVQTLEKIPRASYKLSWMSSIDLQRFAATQRAANRILIRLATLSNKILFIF